MPPSPHHSLGAPAPCSISGWIQSRPHRSGCVKAGSYRNDYERIQLKTDLRLVKIVKSKVKHFHICLKHMFANNFVKLFFIIHNFSLS